MHYGCIAVVYLQTVGGRVPAKASILANIWNCQMGVSPFKSSHAQCGEKANTGEIQDGVVQLSVRSIIDSRVSCPRSSQKGGLLQRKLHEEIET